MKAIILSAGQGRRLLPLTAEHPKAAIAVGRQSVLEWQLQEIGQCAVDEVVVVTGFGAEHIDEIVARQTYVPTRTLYNPFFAQCDNLGTCWIARHEMEAPYLIINGDTLFEARVLQRLLQESADAPITLVTDSKASYDDDDMKVVRLFTKKSKTWRKAAPNKPQHVPFYGSFSRSDRPWAEAFKDALGYNTLLAIEMLQQLAQADKPFFLAVSIMIR